MENLLFSLNATVPVFLLMVLGYTFKRIGLLDDHVVSWANKFVFQVALPVLVFSDLAGEDFYEAWDGGFVLFCFVATSASILAAAGLSLFLKNRRIRGEFVQASYRSSAALLGIAFIQNIYGDSGMAPLMIIGTVPLYNAMAVIVLSLTGNGTDGGSGSDTDRVETVVAGTGHGSYVGAKTAGGEAAGPGATGDETAASRTAGGETVTGGSLGMAGSRKRLDQGKLRSTLKGIVTNPIILGIVLGLLWSVLRLPIPTIMDKTLSYLSALASPLGLMAMGASFDWDKAKSCAGPAVAATVLKLVGFSAVILPIAIALGYRQEALVAILVMAGSATTVSCYVMARNMGHEGTLTSSVVMLTTLFSAFTLTAWLFLLRTLGLV